MFKVTKVVYGRDGTDETETVGHVRVTAAGAMGAVSLVSGLSQPRLRELIDQTGRAEQREDGSLWVELEDSAYLVELV